MTPFDIKWGENMQKLLFLSLVVAASIIFAAVSAVPVIATDVCTAPILLVTCNGLPIGPNPAFPIQFNCNGPVVINCCGNGGP